MCGILGVLRAGGASGTSAIHSDAVKELSARQRHRGPDGTGCVVFPGAALVHERLAIVDLAGGTQPLCNEDRSVAIVVNGEIYNHLALREELEAAGQVFTTSSDCEVLLRLYLAHGPDFMQRVPVLGMFAFFLYDAATDTAVVGRDHIGIIPLYWARNDDGSVWVASELKCLVNHDRLSSPTGVAAPATAAHFPPASTWCSKTGKVTKFHDPAYWATPPTKAYDPDALMRALVAAVDSHLMADVPYGVLLSGGLDSSTIAAVAVRILAERQAKQDAAASATGEPGEATAVAGAAGDAEATSTSANAGVGAGAGTGAGAGAGTGHGASGGTSAPAKPDAFAALGKQGDRQWQPSRLITFSLGMEDSRDTMFGAEVAEYLGTEHHTIRITAAQAVEAVTAVVKCMETYDSAVIRPGCMMHFMSKYIRDKGIKVVLSGEGADEVFAGYMHFKNIKDKDELHREISAITRQLYRQECLRANMGLMSHSVELRVPLLDRAFLDVAMDMDPAFKLPCAVHDKARGAIEKWVLRDAVARVEPPLLPDSVLWRCKEGLSSGVGDSYWRGLMALYDANVSDEELASAGARWPHNTPNSKEEVYLRRVFESHFGDTSGTAPDGSAAAARATVESMWRLGRLGMPEGTAWHVDENSTKREHAEGASGAPSAAAAARCGTTCATAGCARGASPES